MVVINYNLIQWNFYSAKEPLLIMPLIYWPVDLDRLCSGVKMEDQEEFVYDEVTGGKGKKKVLDALNKSKLSKHEMDDLFCSWE